MPNDGGNLLLTAEEASELTKADPRVTPFVRRFLSAKEYLNDVERYCLWLASARPSEVRRIPAIRDRVARVQKYRRASSRPTTRELAALPHRFGEIRQPESDYILIPRHSSETRKYIPLSYFGPEFIVADSCLALEGASVYDFGILSSLMHMAWVRQVAGRLESRYRYSAKLVYNNYPWPPNVTDTKRRAVETAAQRVLDVREAYPEASLADLYDPLSMPADLAKAHAKLDRAVDRCYRTQPFANERNRVEYLFRLFGQLTSPLLPTKPARGKKR